MKCANLNVGICVEMLPFKAPREAGEAANNFRSFMNEWFEEKKAKIELDNKTGIKPSSRADLMGILIASNNNYCLARKLTNMYSESLVRSSGLDKGSTLEIPSLSKSDVIGNAFVQAHPPPQRPLANSLQMFILAGHETTAHTIAHAIYFLAIYPEYQVKLQKEIDSILGDSDHNQTSYDTHYDTFSSGWIAAILVCFPTHCRHSYYLREIKNSSKPSVSFPQ